MIHTCMSLRVATRFVVSIFVMLSMLECYHLLCGHSISSSDTRVTGSSKAATGAHFDKDTFRCHHRTVIPPALYGALW
jgi:hypothetical protein